MTETVAAPRTLDDTLKDAIRKAYTTLQANTPGFSTRRSQSQMIGVVSRALSKSGGVGVVEAPTGVGKSLGYLTAGVPIALATRKKLVISTGTVALQSQLVERDIPNFLKATGLEATVALAKGRTRYLCTRNAAEHRARARRAACSRRMHHCSTAGADRDGHRQAPDRCLYRRQLGRRYRQCAGDHQPRPAQPHHHAGFGLRRAPLCVFGAVRGTAFAHTVRDAQIVVTNHALLLSALSIGDSDNGQPLIAPPSDMLLVLDEGHHIGNVAIGRARPAWRWTRWPSAPVACRS